MIIIHCSKCNNVLETFNSMFIQYDFYIDMQESHIPPITHICGERYK